MIAPTYPGVYIEEIPSGVRTITGAATSVAAFIGRAQRGPVEEPILISSFGEFERTFGGLWLTSSLGFAVRAFFQNGGGQAVVVRLFEAPAGTLSSRIVLGDGEGSLELEPVSPGSWGAQLRVRIDPLDDDVRSLIAGQFQLPQATLFNLRVRDLGTGREELHQNLTLLADHAQSVDRVLAHRSELVRCVRMSESTPDVVPPALPPPAAGEPWWRSEDAAARPETPPTDGESLEASSFIGPGTESAKRGLYALEKADIFNLLCIPPYRVGRGNDASLWQAAATYCERRRAMLLVDPDPDWGDASRVDTSSVPTSANAAVFYPALIEINPLRGNQVEAFAPSGAIAGVIARTDAERGVWKAPAGLDAALKGTTGLSVSLTDSEIGRLNPLGVNCLKTAPAAGRVVWGARTTVGDDRLASEWKYIPVRRLALNIEETLYRGTQWAVFEPNDEPLWAQLRLNIGTFMHGLFRQGAFRGSKPSEAYFVQCDRRTTTPADVDQGIVNILVGFAPLKPAEFVVVKLQQIAGQNDA